MLTEEMYSNLQAYCDPFLTKPYSDLRSIYESNSRYFKNVYGLDDVWKLPQEVGTSAMYDHDTQKTVKGARIIINSMSKKGDLVVIGFGGSGTECEAAEIEGREWVAYEIEEKHVKTATDRLNKLKSKPQLF